MKDATRAAAAINAATLDARTDRIALRARTFGYEDARAEIEHTGSLESVRAWIAEDTARVRDLTRAEYQYLLGMHSALIAALEAQS